MLRVRPLAAWLTVGAVSGTLLATQDPPAGQPERTTQPIRTEANFVRVDAYPTAGGNPVQDLTAAEFELLEDGVPQKIETFEHVVVRPAGPQTATREPSSVAESLQAAADPRSRVFVLFLDVPHVSLLSAGRIREPLIRLLDRILGPDDLVGMMTPAMSAAHVVLGRKTEAIEAGLRRAWPWGERFEDRLDATELQYVQCYPRLNCERNPGVYSELAARMIERRRELVTLEALQDLVRYLGAIREERKAILAVSEGWLLLREAPELMKLRQCGKYTEPIPGIPEVEVSPEGTLTTADRRDPYGATKYKCDTDRMRLASTDHERFFRDVMHEANRFNASFYPIDPRGLAAFDHPINREAPPPLAVDRAMLASRLDSLRTLAENTDGLAVMSANDLDASLKRIADDLTSYYLLGYYSTNPKLDGGFRRITVRVKRPGVDVRARRGYRAATAEEVAAARSAADPPGSPPVSPHVAAFAALARIRPEARFRIHATAVSGQPMIWVAGEVLRTASGAAASSGGTAEIEAVVGTHRTATTVSLQPGERGFLARLHLPWSGREPLRIRARLAPRDGIPLTDAIELSTPGEMGQPLLFRRGPLTGNRFQPAADVQFTRNERLRLELPLEPGFTPGEAVLLDRAGQALQVPVTVATRMDNDAQQFWMTAELALAALAIGDYAVALAARKEESEQRVITAFRMIR